MVDFFLEYDTGTEPLSRLIAKLAGYAALAARTGITTPVLFWLPSARREAALRARLAGPPPPGTRDAASAAQIPGVPVATAAPGTSPEGPAGPVWLPAGSPGPRRRLAQLAPSGTAPADGGPADETPGVPPGGLAWHPPYPAPPAWYALHGELRPGRPTMTSRAARVGRAVALLTFAALLCGGCSLLPRTAASPLAPASTSARPAAAASPRPATATTPLASLPFPTARLQAAAVLAGRFTAAWDSWSWRQSPAAWLAQLRPMAAASLEPALAQAAGDRGVLAQRAAARQTARATVTALAIRDLTPGSVTVTVTVAQVITASGGTSRASAGWAVTLTPAGAGWSVWDIEPAAAGNT